MRIDQAKTIPINEYLAFEGDKPVQSRHQGKELWYQSPIRQGERTASFKVDTNLNRWYDHGAGKGGNTVDLVVELHRATVRDALRILERTGLYSSTAFAYTSNLRTNYGRKASSGQNKLTSVGDIVDQKKKALEAQRQAQASENQDTSLKLTRQGPIRHPALLQYLEAREIDKALAQKYLKEVRFMGPDGGKEFFALGWLTGNGETWEVRNSRFKGIVGCTKSITHLETSGASKCVVFEGFFDFLAFMTQQNYKSCPYGVIVLSSTALKSRAVTTILETGYKEIDLYLDNDATGSEATQYFENLLSTLQVTDCRSQYQSSKDLNDMLMQQEA